MAQSAEFKQISLLNTLNKTIRLQQHDIKERFSKLGKSYEGQAVGWRRG